MSATGDGEDRRALTVVVEPGKCCASGNCVLIVPEVFDQAEDDGTVVLLEAEPAPGLHRAVTEAADVCPVSAITVRRP